MSFAKVKIKVVVSYSFTFIYLSVWFSQQITYIGITWWTKTHAQMFIEFFFYLAWLFKFILPGVSIKYKNIKVCIILPNSLPLYRLSLSPRLSILKARTKTKKK